MKLRELVKLRATQIEEPKFIRDSMKIDDISGARSRQLYRGVAKDILAIRDIEGTKPRYERIKPRNYNPMDYSDVTSRKRQASDSPRTDNNSDNSPSVMDNKRY